MSLSRSHDVPGPRFFQGNIPASQSIAGLWVTGTSLKKDSSFPSHQQFIKVPTSLYSYKCLFCSTFIFKIFANLKEVN